MNSERKTERQVGIFVFVGIVLTCVMVIYFGKVGDRFRSGIPITVEFSNAGGLVPGAQVLYSGVLIGKVDHIKLDPERGGVDVEVNLFKEAKVRKDAHFMIKQSGLLGDQNLVVVPVSQNEAVLQAGDRIKGNDPFDFSDMASKVNAAFDRLTNEFLQKETLDDLKLGLKNFAELTKKLQSDTERLNGILGNVEKGKGTVGKLLTDDELFQELKRLIHNWRVHGLLYQEKSDEKYPSPRTSSYPEDRSEDK
jgi:phospholipid/cholesterol/gamma-HCH transport system substrate-binding protein